MVYIGLEATSRYGFHLLDYFSCVRIKHPMAVKLYQVSVSFILASISRTLTALKQNLKQLDMAIQGESKGFNNPLLSVKGIGYVYATGILASVGDIKRFFSHNQLARLAGLVWKKINQESFNQMKLILYENVINS